MSYWVYVVDENNQEIWSGNMTSNVGAMYEMALAPYLPDQDDYGIRILHDMPCVGAVYLLEHAMALMENHKIICRALEPSNGWGTYEAALDFLYQIWRHCEGRNSKIHVSW